MTQSTAARLPDAAPLLPPQRLEALLAPRLNLAFHQNAVPVLHSLTVVNDAAHALEDVELVLRSEPEFLKAKSWRIDRIAARQRFPISGLDVAVDGATLARLTEAETAQVSFILRSHGEEKARLDMPLELLARNQWGGIGSMPEMVAAFVQPNAPAVERVLKSASEHLRAHGKSGALDGYQGGPKRAWELVSATWAAIAGLGLDYALPPASFEHAGQKVRGPDQILEAGLATCLDVTLLFSAAIEQCGLHPLVVFTRGHAFAGLWLRAEAFPTAVVDDVTALRKGVRLKEIVLFEATLVTQRPCPSFAQAIEHGARQVAESAEDDFELAVDVHRARLQRIRPLASENVPAQAAEAAQQPVRPPAFEEAPDLPAADATDEVVLEPLRPQDRLDRWQRKLLDLSLRNSLLNFRATKGAVRIDAPNPGAIEDLLAQGKVLKLLPRPELMDGNDPRSRELHEARTREELHAAHARDALTRGELMVPLTRDELDARLVELYRNARTALQEGGANTLFLALGFLSWTQEERSEKRLRAPLVLVPVTLQRKSVRSGFSLVLHEDEARFNPTLVEMLRQDFKLELPIDAGELARDEHGLDVDGIQAAVARAVKDIRGWEVVEDVVLATFSFAKYLMWKDLVERTDQLKQNPVVRHLLETPRERFPSTLAFPEPRTLDDRLPPEQTFCPLPADSSQLSAVVAGSKGKDFVLVGPPGTGKSQTIANLIAQCLAERKTVLFVSEKIAALEVVYRRLRDAGLGEFCLELHSNKARKLDVLQQLGRSWEAKGEVDAAAWQREAQRLAGLRRQLNGFVERLHRRHRNGLSAHTAIGRVLAGEGLPRLGLAWPTPDALDADALAQLGELAERLEVNARLVAPLALHPLGFVTRSDWSAGWQRRLVEAARTVPPVAEQVVQAAARFEKVLNLPEVRLDRRRREGLAALAKALPDAAGRDWAFVVRSHAHQLCEALRAGSSLVVRHRELKAQLSQPWSTDLRTRVDRAIELVTQHRVLVAQLSAPFGAGRARLDVLALEAEWKRAVRSYWPASWFRRRAVRATLVSALVRPQNIDIEADLPRLVGLRALEEELDGLKSLVTELGRLWSGLDTSLDDLRAAIAFQDALAATRAGRGRREEGLEAIAAGRCGQQLADDLHRMRELDALEVQLGRLENLRASTGGTWLGLDTRLDEVDRALSFHAAVSTAIARLATTAGELATITGPMEQLLGLGKALLEPTGPVAGVSLACREALDAFEQAANGLASLAGVTPNELPELAGETPGALAESAGRLLALEPKLHAWCSWLSVRAEAIGKGLSPLVVSIESGALRGQSARAVFEAAYARWWLDAMVDRDIVLRTFVSAEHENRIDDFRRLDDEFTNLTRAHLRAGLCAGLPPKEGPARSTEWGLLKREMQKKRQHLPLRSLLQELPTALSKLAPCLLMSPLSIAQYLSPDSAPFDLVVFDEASQIPVWDAIGAIARGRQVVMVGDPKQLPPTSFFDRAEADEQDAEVEDDLESILDECLGANLPTLDLSWHYRSRHESLIAFSNHRYYGGGLVTFPSPVTDDRAVSLHLVPDGSYEKGGARTNKPEARALVADVVSRLKDPAFRAAGLTVGVVTFNSEQQRLIQDLLDEEQRRAPDLETYFSDERLEPVFVKNIESVQGDERDVMYFSLTYGPDASGAVSMNFGPMNRDGGERRLNVAVTRARHALRVFSSLRPEQLDLSRTQARGVRDLKLFMEFALRGSRALADAVSGSVGGFDSPFEEAVAVALERRGWQVQTQIGVSAFRIDLGIVDPDAPGRYLAGVECDGATYHRSATARDRDKLREQVLRGLGWEILRIWSTDWWHDSAGALDRVHGRLEALLADSRARREATPDVRPEVASAEPSPVAADSETPSSDRTPAPGPRKPTPDTAVFREADLDAFAAAARPDEFYDAEYEATLRTHFARVVEIEGPVRIDVLARRIARIHDWQRTGARIKERVSELAMKQFVSSSEDVGLFLWPAGSDPTNWATFRRPSDGSRRPVDEIALPELVALAREVSARGLSGEAALGAMSREAGLGALKAVSRERLLAAWRSLNPDAA